MLGGILDVNCCESMLCVSKFVVEFQDSEKKRVFVWYSAYYLVTYLAKFRVGFL